MITWNSKDYLAITKYIKQRKEMHTGEQTRSSRLCYKLILPSRNVGEG